MHLLVQAADGKARSVPLGGGRITVGRASAVELSFPEDIGLSRQHFAFEPEGEDWAVEDLGSKNGTFVNNIPLKGRLILQPGDRVTAGRVVVVFAPEPVASKKLVEFEGEGESERTQSSTTVTSLDAAVSHQTMVFESGARSSAPMQALIGAGQVLAENRPVDELFQAVLDLAIEAVNAQRGVLLILEGDQLLPRAHKGEGFRISKAVRDRVLKEKSSILVRDAQMDDAFKGQVSIVEQKVHTMMAVPLQTRDRIIGLIYVDSRFVLREFTKDDLSLLTIMANQAAFKIVSALLSDVEEVERLMRRDLGQAAEIQKRVLPDCAPQAAHIDLAGFNAACKTVGGDYYDFFVYPDGRVALALGDVSGKGMPASLMMMALQARVQVLAEDPEGLGAFMTRLNKATCAKCPSNRFITFFFCVLDPATGEMAFANAGHNPPVVMRASGESEMLEGGGPVLGILPIAPYGEMRMQLGTGDLLAIYSDGVTEANNPNCDEFGEERLTEVLRKHREEPAAAIVNAVTKAVTEFAAGAPQADDITLVIAKRV